MNKNVFRWGALAALGGWLLLVGLVGLGGLVAGCDSGGGGGGGGSVEAQCDSWCARRNMDEDCGADINCPASCGSIIASAGSRCRAEVEGLFACTTAAEDLCPAGGLMACATENAAYVRCVSAAADAGMPSCDPYGTYTGVSGGTSATACGTMFSRFSDATLTVAEGAGGGALLSVSGTGAASDITDCEATISSSCELSARCVFGDGSSVTYTLTMYTGFFTGRVSVTTSPESGGCVLPWDIMGSR